MPFPGRSSVVILITCLAALAPGRAHGQQEFRLDADDAPSLLLLVNPGQQDVTFEVPDDHAWDLAEDTGQPCKGKPKPAPMPYPLTARSLAVLLGWR